jgi:hypothetical protein
VHRERLVLSLILVVTLTFAVVGIDWGLPYNWHADEKVNLAASMIDRHTLNPNYFVNPTLHVYLVLAVVRAAYAVHPGTFVPSDVRWHILSTKRNAPNRAVTFLAYRLARLLSAVFAALLVWLAWILGRAAFDSTVGLLGAAFLSVTMGLANLAHFATPETTLFFLVLAALGSLQRLAGASRPGSDQGASAYVVAGALIGFACSTKYTVWLLGAPFMAAHIRAQGGIKGALRAWPYVLLAFGAAIAAFIVATPYSLLDARHFVEDMRFNWLTGAPEGTLAGQHRSWGRYVLTLGNALGWPLFVCAAAGGAMTLARIRELDARGAAAVLVHGTWIVSFWLVYGISPHHALRFIIPIVPSLLLLGAAGIVDTARKSPAHRRRVAIATIAVLAYSTVYTAAADRKFLRDPRYAAGSWLKEHIGADSTVGFFANEAYLPYFDRPVFHVQALDVMSQSGFVGEAFEGRIRQILTEGPDVIVDANFYYDRFLDSPARFPERAAFYRRLLTGSNAGGFRPLARFALSSPWWLDPRPELVAPDVVVLGRPR